MRFNRKLTGVAALLILLQGCSSDEQHSQPAVEAEVKPGAVEQLQAQAGLSLGESLFMTYCSECHPRSGRGDYLQKIPATLLTMKSSKELVVWMEGRDQHREMPRFSTLEDKELDALAEFLKAQATK